MLRRRYFLSDLLKIEKGQVDFQPLDPLEKTRPPTPVPVSLLLPLAGSFPVLFPVLFQFPAPFYSFLSFLLRPLPWYVLAIPPVQKQTGKI